MVKELQNRIAAADEARAAIDLLTRKLTDEIEPVVDPAKRDAVALRELASDKAKHAALGDCTKAEALAARSAASDAEEHAEGVSGAVVMLKGRIETAADVYRARASEREAAAAVVASTMVAAVRERLQLAAAEHAQAFVAFAQIEERARANGFEPESFRGFLSGAALLKAAGNPDLIMDAAGISGGENLGLFPAPPKLGAEDVLALIG